VYVSVDTDQHPLSTLLTIDYSLRRADIFTEVYLDGVGSLTAILRSQPCLRLIVQSRRTIDHWAKPAIPFSAGTSTLREVSASLLYQSTRADHQNDYAQIAQLLFDHYIMLAKLPELRDVEPDGYECWTCVSACLDVIQSVHL
jgi:hypothetical protein